MANIEKKQLRDIKLTDENLLISVIIIGKSSPSIFIRNENFHGVIQFTLRDSQQYYTNCKFWGTKEKIDEYNRIFHLNDLVNIICPRIKSNSQQQQQQNNQQYQPLITTSYNLVLQEGYGYMEKLYCDNLIRDRFNDNLKSLISIPIKPINLTMCLADISNNFDITVNGEQQFIDLLVCVRRMKPIRQVQVKNKNNEHVKCLELVVIDKSLPSGMALTIWNNEWINRAEQFWQPLKTILHIIDCRVNYSTFYKNTVLGLSQKSLIFDQLKSKEIDDLKNFAEHNKLADDSSVFAGGFCLPSPDSIITVMTVQQIYDRAYGYINSDSDQFTAVLICTITKFDLDGFNKVYGRKCKFCSRRLLFNQNDCEFEQCQLNISFNQTDDKYDYYFDINVHLSDHTGTLIETRLTNQVAERILSLRIDEFIRMNDDEKANLKWQFLLDKFEVKLLIKKKSSVRNNIAVILIDLNEIQINEIANKILVY